MKKDTYKSISVNFTMTNEKDKELFEKIMNERAKGALIKNLLEKYYENK